MSANIHAQDTLNNGLQRNMYIGVSFNPNIGLGVNFSYLLLQYLSFDLIVESVNEARSFPQFAFGCSIYPIRIVRFQCYYGLPAYHPDASFKPDYSIGFNGGVLIPIGGSNSPITILLSGGMLIMVDKDYKPADYILFSDQNISKRKVTKNENLFLIGIGYHF